MGLDEELKQVLPRNIYSHSVATARMAREMASTFGADERRAYLAGLLHDCAKELTDEELVAAARERGIEVDDVDLADPYLLHARVGARLAEERFGVEDLELLRAIERHTLGAPSMSVLDKIIYVADMIEPSRDFPGLGEIRRLAREDLEACYKTAYAHTLEYLARAKKPIHPSTVAAWNAIVLGGSSG